MIMGAEKSAPEKEVKNMTAVYMPVIQVITKEKNLLKVKSENAKLMQRKIV